MHTVLIVDDDAALRRTLARILARAGFEVIAVEDGADALGEISATQAVSLVVLDFQMPAMMGPEVLRAILAVSPEMPVLMLSAAMSSAEKADALTAGARRCLEKPISPTALVEAVRAALP